MFDPNICYYYSDNVPQQLENICVRSFVGKNTALLELAGVPRA